MNKSLITFKHQNYVTVHQKTPAWINHRMTIIWTVCVKNPITFKTVVPLNIVPLKGTFLKLRRKRKPQRFFFFFFGLPKNGPDYVYFTECLGLLEFFPHNSLLKCVKVVCFRTFPAAFFTTQVKVDVRSSDVMFFNHRLLWRMAPSSKPDLKANIGLSFVPFSG